MADDTYDVFVSYSRADERHAAEIDAVLRDKGLNAKAAIVLIGPRGLGKYTAI